jgi:hypothetical protein
MATIATIAAILLSPVSDGRVNRWEVVRPYNGKLERMAWCESRQRWSLNTGNGFFGGLQFTLRTWYSVGGRGMPHWASEMEQKYRAVLLIRRMGYGPWPVCGFR